MIKIRCPKVLNFYYRFLNVFKTQYICMFNAFTNLFSYLFKTNVCFLFLFLSQMWKYLRTAMKPFGYLILFYFGKYERQSTINNENKKYVFLYKHVYVRDFRKVKVWHKCLIHSIDIMWIGKLWPDMASLGMVWLSLALLHLSVNFPTHHRVYTVYIVSNLVCILLKIFSKVNYISMVHLCSQVGWLVGFIFF